MARRSSHKWMGEARRRQFKAWVEVGDSGWRVKRVYSFTASPKETHSAKTRQDLGKERVGNWSR